MNTHAISRAALLMFIISCCACLPGCHGVRFIIDAVPAEDDLKETTVLEDDDAGWASAKVALVDVRGLIIDARRPGLLANGENPVGRFSEELRRAADDSGVKAIIIRINSPGGTVTASDVMYREVLHFKEETKKPVVVLMSDVAASGGYYVACAADEIIAHPTTITGSIGVIIQTINFADGLGRIGIRADAITSGPNKDMGNPFEPMDPAHRELLQGLVNEFYGNFLAIVQERRPGIPQEALQRVTDGRVVTGRDAAAVGLVDSLGDLRTALTAAKARAGVERARVIRYHRAVEYVGSPYAASPVDGARAGATQINLLQLELHGEPMMNGTGFYYLWDPSVW